MSPLKIKIPNINKSIIECHADALPAFMIEKNYKYQYESLNLSRKTIQQFQSLDPVHAIEISRNTYHFFSGWFWLPYCRHLNCGKVTVIVHSKIEQYDIQQAAWMYLLSNQFKSFHRHNNLIQLKHYLDSVPDHIEKNLFNSIDTGSSQVIVQRLSNETRSVVRSQEKHFKSLKASISKPSIREELTGSNKSVS